MPAEAGKILGVSVKTIQCWDVACGHIQFEGGRFCSLAAAFLARKQNGY